MTDVTTIKRNWRAATLALLLVATMLVLVPGTQNAAQAAALDGPAKLADFEGGPPAGWFTFFGGSTVDTTTSVISDTDPLALPGQAGDNEVLDVDFNVTDFGGFGQDVALALGGPQDWSGTAGFSFWFNGSGSGLTYQAEISDNRSDPNSDTAERFDYEFTDGTAGWQKVSIPWSDFTRATDFQPGGAPDDGFTLTEVWAWAIVLPLGSDLVHFDNVALDPVVVDDFENGLAAGTDGDGNPIGFVTFNDPDSSVAVSATSTPPAPVPNAATPNNVLQVDTDVNNSFGFAGVIHAFENDTVDTWVPQDWSGFTGVAFWLYGNNTGSIMFVDILDNRAPGTTTDTAERFSLDIIDDFSGWKYIEIPFDSLNRKEIGNGAPNDGLTLTEVHGWAFGVFNSGVAFTNYIDDVALFGVADIPELTVGFAANEFDITEGDTGLVTVKLNRALGDDDPDEVSVEYAVESIVPIPGRDYVHPPAGTLTFAKGEGTEQSFAIETLDDSKYEPTERLIARLSNPVDVALGVVIQASANIINDDPYDPNLLDDFERSPDLWSSSPTVELNQIDLAASDGLAVPGQGAFEGVLEATVPLHVDVSVDARVCNRGSGVIPVTLYSTTTFDATTVDHTSVTMGNASEAHIARRTGIAKRHVADINKDGLLDLVFHFRFSETGLPCDPAVVPFNGFTFDGQPITAGGSDASFGRDFPIGNDWSSAEALSFWYYGSGSGDTVTLEVKDNRAPDPGPSGWDMVWSDEFDDAAGTPPNPDNWGYELGDGTSSGIPGWGNSELQYYTDSPENAATDGAGNLVITAADANGSVDCYYGPCDYTSARLATTNKAEFAYGRIESRVLVPDGEDGLWPAFWSLGTDIELVDWPQTGEIDIMEYVSRLPDEIFGTIHGPGYSGGSSFGNTYPFPGGVSTDYHTFAIEWQPDLIEWFVDDILYHSATPADVAPNEWVFNDAVYLLLNLAIGGNFGGTVSEDLVFPQTMKVDYVRVYQGPDTAEVFEATFVDDAAGWQQVIVPFTDLVRSAEQPVGAPDDGLGLTDVWGYGFGLPDVGSTVGTLMLDQVRLVAIPAPTEIVVTNANNDGAGSLRTAVADVAEGGTVLFDPAVTGGAIALTSGPIVIAKAITIDAADAPGFVIDGGGVDRVVIVDSGVSATMSNITLSNGYGFQLGGCVINNGSLTLDHVTVAGCAMTTDAGDFWQGGGGIYNGEFSSLVLVDSTVADNTAGWSGGGVYSFFNTQTTVVRSTISGNSSADVGGGLRLLGNAEIVNSTISGNESTGWYGGALFLTDGVADMTNTTVTNNVSPEGGPAAVFVGTFGDTSATLNVTNSIIAGNTTEGCFLAPFGSGAVAINSLGGNVFSDSTCFGGTNDLVDTDPLLGALADNGGPTLTHALLAGSPAIDAGIAELCPSEDQRGVFRPQGAGCDAGAFELE